MSRGHKEQQPYWRPNFVNQSGLPDIKVVRTDFIINFIAVTLVLCVAFFLGQREYRAHALRQTIAQMEQQIRTSDKADADNLKKSESFRESAEYILEVEKFYDAPLLAHQFLYDLSIIKPDNLIFNSISLNESVVKQGKKSVIGYSINLNGDAKNLTVIDEFKSILQDAELLQVDGYEVVIDETLQGRDEKTGIFPYRIAITLRPAQVSAAGKSKEGGA